MNVYISLAILAVFAIWYYFAEKEHWELAEVVSLALGFTWLFLGVLFMPIVVIHSTKVLPYNSPKVECTSRICQVEAFGHVFDVDDAYTYNMLRDSTYESVAVEYEYNWWGDNIGENLIVE